MKKILKKLIVVLTVFVLAVSAVPMAEASFSASVSTVKIGLYYTDSAGTTYKNYFSANLQNVTGYGNGYEFGYFDSNREFVSIGASTDTNKITMIIDKNMRYDAATNSYIEGTTGSIVIGCFHIQLATQYPNYSAAREAADSFTSAKAFVKYYNDGYYVCVGSYTSAADASSAAAQMNIAQEYSINSGTSYTICVVKTGTNEIIIEFDCGSSRSLGVMPIGAEKMQTYFKYNKYYGAFQYSRVAGGNITVVNYVNIEDYIKGVIPYEMSASWPIEALKAQSVCARTYVMANLNKHKAYGFDVCNTTDCQVYKGTGSATSNSDSAVEETEGQYLTYNGMLCNTFYYSCNGGASENSENVWLTSYGYLKGVIDPYEAAVASKISNYNWTVTLTGDQLASKLRAKGYNCTTIKSVEITKFTDTGNVYSIRFTDANGTKITLSKEAARTYIGLRSQRYTVSGGSGGTTVSSDIYVNSSSTKLSGDLSDMYGIGSSGTDSITGGNSVYAITGSGTVEEINTGTEIADGTFVFSGSGYGHNVGMSQWGAYSMAKNYSKTYTDILTFYYSNTDIVESVYNGA